MTDDYKIRIYTLRLFFSQLHIDMLRRWLAHAFLLLYVLFNVFKQVLNAEWLIIRNPFFIVKKQNNFLHLRGAIIRLGGARCIKNRIV